MNTQQFQPFTSYLDVGQWHGFAPIHNEEKLNYVCQQQAQSLSFQVEAHATASTRWKSLQPTCLTQDGVSIGTFQTVKTQRMAWGWKD